MPPIYEFNKTSSYGSIEPAHVIFRDLDPPLDDEADTVEDRPWEVLSNGMKHHHGMGTVTYPDGTQREVDVFVSSSEDLEQLHAAAEAAARQVGARGIALDVTFDGSGYWD